MRMIIQDHLGNFRYNPLYESIQMFVFKFINKMQMNLNVAPSNSMWNSTKASEHFKLKTIYKDTLCSSAYVDFQRKP